MNIIRKILGKPKYQAKIGGPWTLHELLRQFSTELSTLNPQLEKDTLRLEGRKDFEIVFIRNQFPSKDNIVEINGTIITPSNNYVADLFLLAKSYFGDRSRPLGIYKDQSWTGSKMQTEVREFYLPFLSEITKLRGDEITSARMSEVVSRLKNSKRSV